jgi:hypothetical protein
LAPSVRAAGAAVCADMGFLLYEASIKLIRQKRCKVVATFPGRSAAP